MALTSEERLEVRARMGSDYSARRESFALSKPEFDAAIAAVDDWIDANAASYNAAIPQPARSTLTALQKTELLYQVARRRYMHG